MMLLLQRTVRFAVNPPRPGEVGGSGVPMRRHNPFGGSPAIRGLGRHYEIDITCRGMPDPTTGYFVDIKRIDDAARTAAIPIVCEVCNRSPHADPGYVAALLVRPLVEELQRSAGAELHAVGFRPTPFASWEILPMESSSRVLLRQRFDFAAAHRLAVPGWTDEQNQQTFGKCANPNGHGHNYRIEPCVETDAPSNPDEPPAFSLDDLERITDETLLTPFDHKHLNRDTPQFADNGGLNPSVENIAMVFFRLLEPRIAEASGGKARLRNLTVWETDKTCCTYPA